MKRFSEQFKKQADNVTLRKAETRDLKTRLVSYMEYHPLPNEMKSKDQKATANNWNSWFGYMSSWELREWKGAVMSLSLILAVVVPLAAERTVPGDILYPVKVRFNEEVRSTLTLSTYEKVEWETKRLERRLAEARLLADAGKLTNEVQVGVAVAVKEHSEAVEKGIDELRASDSDEAAIAEISFAAALDVQSEVLESEIARDAEAGNTSSVNLIADAVKEAKDKTEGKDAKPGFDKLLGRVEQETTYAYELFHSISSVTSEEEREDVQIRLGDVENKIVSAIAIKNTPVTPATTKVVATTTEAVVSEDLSGSGDINDTVVAEEVSELSNEEEAILLLKEVLSDIKKLISFMTDIDVKENVAIEDLVPKELTDEEVLVVVGEYNTKVTDFLNLYEVTIDEFTETDAFTAGYLELTKLNEGLISGLESRDFKLLRSNIKAIKALHENVVALAPEVEETVTKESETNTSESERVLEE